MCIRIHGTGQSVHLLGLGCMDMGPILLMPPLMQGEQDGKNGDTARSYNSNFEAFVRQARTALAPYTSDPSTPESLAVVMGVMEARLRPTSQYPDLDIVRQQQLAFTMPGVYKADMEVGWLPAG